LQRRQTMSEEGYNIIAPEKGRADQGVDEGRAAGVGSAPAATERGAAPVYFQVGRGHAGRVLGYRCDRGQRDSDEGGDHSRSRRGGYWVQHDGRPDGPERQRSPRESQGSPRGDREGCAAWTHYAWWTRRSRSLGNDSCSQLGSMEH